MKKLASPRSGRDAQNFAKKKIAQGAKAKKINKCFTIQYRKEKTRHKGEKKITARYYMEKPVEADTLYLYA